MIICDYFVLMNKKSPTAKSGGRANFGLFVMADIDIVWFKFSITESRAFLYSQV